MSRQRGRKSLGWMIATIIVGSCLGYLLWFYTSPSKVVSMETAKGQQVKFRTHGTAIEKYDGESWKPFFAKGVNIGASLPGHYPGELPITKQDYLNWFALIDEMGADVIRIYTIHPPVFYEALVEFNRKKQGEPLYFMQGIWSPEEALIAQKDAYLPEIKEEFKAEIAQTVTAVYGAGEIPEKPGKASGKYKVNAGPYLMAWHVGTEWDPEMVSNTNKLHADAEAYQGRHFRAKQDASPFESWLAELIDHTAQLEREHGWEHPLTFTNWVTTDPLDHPGEPILHEDMVTVDPEHIEPVDWEAGYFAAYHVYPYYPDFFRYDQSFQTVTNERGEVDTYKAYLRQLKEYHQELPVMVTEYGVPASLGNAHIGRLGRHQGGHSEQEQGEINAELTKEIYEEGYAGAILFSWHDEWFKRTWNTMRFELPEDRRSFWLNVLTNESMFGLLGMYPGKEGRIVIDGKADDWEDLKSEEKMQLHVDQPGWEEVLVTHDEAYLYLLVKLAEPFDPEQEIIYLGVNTTPGGNKHAPEMGAHVLDEGLETLIVLGRDQESEVRIASNYDFHTRLYGKKYDMLPVNEAELKQDSGVFKPWKLAVSLEMTPPDSKLTLPFEDVDTGKLLRGTNDPTSPAYNSLTAWQAEGNVVEMRIPWMLLGFTDPSSLQVMSYEDSKTGFVSKTTDGIQLVPWKVERASGKVIGLGDGRSIYPVTKLPRYSWPTWESVDYHERPKQSYQYMKQAFLQIANEGQ